MLLATKTQVAERFEAASQHEADGLALQVVAREKVMPEANGLLKAGVMDAEALAHFASCGGGG